MKHILQLLDHTVRRWGSRPAFGDEHRTLTWNEVEDAVQRIGTALAGYGVQRRPVAIYLDHEVPCLLAMLGTLAAGGFYTVLDTAQPPDRVRRITSQLSPALLVTDGAHRDAADALGLACPVVDLDEALATAPDGFLLQTLREQAIDTDLAYVLFTSGSTGTPKGVAIQHRAVLAYSAWSAGAFGIDETTVFGNQTPFYFSMSVTDIYTALRTGARVQVIPKRLFSFPVQLLDYLTTQEVNTLYWVPSALGGVVRWKALDYTALPPLRTILFAGETMPTPYLNYWRAHYPAALFANLFGPTETTDICSYYIVDRDFADDEPLPIGRACDNCGILQHARQDRRAVLSQPAAAPLSRDHLPHRGPGALRRGRTFAVHGPGGQPDQTHGLPHRAGRDRDGGLRAGGAAELCLPVRRAPGPAGALLHRQKGAGGIAAAPAGPASARLHAAHGVPPSAGHAPEPERKNRPRRTGRPVQGGLNYAYYG